MMMCLSSPAPASSHPKPLAPLTTRQAQTLRFIAEFIAAHGYAPTQRETAAALGISTASVHDRFETLASKGYIEKTPAIAQGIAITGDGARWIHQLGPA